MNYIFFDLETDGSEFSESAYCTLVDEPVIVKPDILVLKLLEADVIVGHNIKAWDIPILEEKFSELKKKCLHIWDTLEIEAILRPLAGSLALEAKHNAKDDVAQTLALFLSQVNRIRKEGLTDRICGLLQISPDDLPDNGVVGTEPEFMPIATRTLPLNVEPSSRSLIIAPRIFWPYLTGIQGLTFHYSASHLNDIVDIDYTPVKKPSVVRELTDLFASRFVDECQSRGLQPMVFLMPDYLRYRFRYKTRSFLNLLDLGAQDTNIDRNLLCVDPCDLTQSLLDEYDNILQFEPEYASFCGGNILDKNFRLPENLSIRRVGDSIRLSDGTCVRKMDFNSYAKYKPLNISKISSTGIHLPEVTEIAKFTDYSDNSHWQAVSEIIGRQTAHLVVAVVHDESDIPFLEQHLRNNEMLNIPQIRIRERRSFHKYVDLATRDNSLTGVVIVTSSALAGASFRYEHDAAIILCDDDIFDLWRIPDASPDPDTLNRVWTSLIRSVFPLGDILRITKSSCDRDFLVAEPSDSPEIIKEKIRKNLINGASFRDGQEDYLNVILKGGNHFVCLPTGTGKSVLFQGPAFYATNRLSIVISPLRALIREQVSKLRKKNHNNDVDYLISGHSEKYIFDGIRSGRIRLLYITPEQFLRSRLISTLQQRADRDDGLGYVIFDEAHCISNWGMSFRASYLHATLGCMRLFPNERYLFFSATLPESVKDDIRFILGEDVDIHCRPGVRYLNERIVPRCIPIKAPKGEKDQDPYPNRYAKVAHILRSSELDWSNSIAFVFFDDRDRGEKLTNFLKERFPDISERIINYHAGLKDDEKDAKETDIKEGRVSIIVCTKAMGMGIDIGNIHLVIHVKRPGSLEDYLQEIGRAGRETLPRGRDNIEAVCLDTRKITDSSVKTTWDDVKRVFDGLCKENEIAKGREFTKGFRRPHSYDRMNRIISPDYGKILFLLKRAHRIEAKREAFIFSVKAIRDIDPKAEIDNDALALLWYIKAENAAGNYEIIPEKALDSIGRYTADAETIQYSETLKKLENKGYVICFEPKLISITQEVRPAFNRYRDHSGIQILFKYLRAFKNAGKEDEVSYEKGERYYHNDAKKIHNLLSKYPYCNLDRVQTGFEAMWKLVTSKYGPDEDVIKTIPKQIRFDNIISQDSDDCHSDFVIPYKMLTLGPFVSMQPYDTYRISVLDTSPIDELEDDIGLRLAVQNKANVLKQDICWHFMEKLAEEGKAFDIEKFITKYFNATLSPGTDIDTILAPFINLLNSLL